MVNAWVWGASLEADGAPGERVATTEQKRNARGASRKEGHFIDKDNIY